MQRFTEKLKHNYGSILVDIPARHECIITCDSIDNLDTNKATYHIYIEGKFFSTIPAVTNWDKFVKENLKHSNIKEFLKNG